MKDLTLAFNRSFRVWDYIVSHDRMLIRSPKTDEQNENIDIILTGVEYINIPTMLDVISVNKYTIEQKAEIIPDSIRENAFAQIVLQFESKQGDYWILCAELKIEKNDLGLMDTSLKYDFE